MLPQQINNPQRRLTPNTTQERHCYHQNCLSSNESLHAIARAKNIIAFFRFLNEGLFRNSDPRSFVVIEDGQFLGIYDNEKKARDAAEKMVAEIYSDDGSGELTENQCVDGMVFPVSGKFKKRDSGHFNGYVFDPCDPISHFE